MSGSQKTRVIIVLGPPGSGKGTQCKRLAKTFGFVHLSTGDACRDAAAKGTELGKLAEDFIRRGEFIPDDVIVNLVRTRIQDDDVKGRGILLDGCPRTQAQAQAFAGMAEQCIVLQISDDLSVQRVLHRLIDPVTDEIYHSIFRPPPKQVISRLVHREYDRDENIARTRVAAFKKQIEQIVPVLQTTTHFVDASPPPDAVYAKLAKFISAGNPDNKSDSVLVEKVVVEKVVVKSERKEMMCAVCLDKRADFLCTPCGHQCGCEECLTGIQKIEKPCPICNTKIQSIVRVFQAGVEEDGDAKMHVVAEPEVKEPPAEEKKGGEQDGGWGPDAAPGEEVKGDGTFSPSTVSMTIGPVAGKVSGLQGLMNAVIGKDTVNVMVRLDVPEVYTRDPVDICCCVDISGSMRNPASYEDENGRQTNDGLSILDLVCHSVRTVLHTLTPQDRFSLVAFDDRADVVFPLAEMTPENRAQAENVLHNLKPRGMTNLWGGLQAGMDSLRTAPAPPKPRKSCVLLLTDGQPSVVPSQGHLKVLRDYRDTHRGFNFQINTFGFGYELDSGLLLDLANEGGGTFSFIPDAKIVGTCFVNCVANVVSTLTQGAVLHLATAGGAQFAGPVLGNLRVTEASWGRVVSVGALTHGQSRDIVVPMKFPIGSQPYLEVTLIYPAGGIEYKATGSGADRNACPPAISALARCEVVTNAYNAVMEAENGRLGVAQTAMTALTKKMAAYYAADGRLLGLKSDVEGRMTKALTTKDRFHRWGKHFLRALIRSHQLQQCTNFMDPGLQPYGGALFRALRDSGGKVFTSLPAPLPSLQPPSPLVNQWACPQCTLVNPNSVRKCQICDCAQPKQLGAAGSSSPPAAAAVQAAAVQAASPRAVQAPAPVMQDYYEGSGGGCFGPLALVSRVSAEGDVATFVQNVRAGDLLRVAGGGTATVVCVVKIARSGPLLRLESGLTITPSHPIRINGVWLRPKELENASVENESGFVYNFVLSSSHVLLINEVECITWGHNFTGPVVGHPFYGSAKVVTTLQRSSTWQTGEVCVRGRFRDQHRLVFDLLI